MGGRFKAWIDPLGRTFPALMSGPFPSSLSIIFSLSSPPHGPIPPESRAVSHRFLPPDFFLSRPPLILLLQFPFALNMSPRPPTIVPCDPLFRLTPAPSKLLFLLFSPFRRFLKIAHLLCCGSFLKSFLPFSFPWGASMVVWSGSICIRTQPAEPWMLQAVSSSLVSR